MYIIYVLLVVDVYVRRYLCLTDGDWGGSAYACCGVILKGGLAERYSLCQEEGVKFDRKKARQAYYY